MALNAHRVSKGVKFSNLLMKYQMRSNCKTQKEGSHNSYNKNLKYPHSYIWQLQNEKEEISTGHHNAVIAHCANAENPVTAARTLLKVFLNTIF
jgi:hypothetical protein